MVLAADHCMPLPWACLLVASESILDIQSLLLQNDIVLLGGSSGMAMTSRLWSGRSLHVSQHQLVLYLFTERISCG